MLTERLEQVNERLDRLQIRHGIPSAVRGIKSLLDGFAAKGLLPYESEGILYGACQSFWTVFEGEQLVGCSSLRILSDEVGELRSLAVARDMQGVGIGRDLLHYALQEADAYGLKHVCAFTVCPEFFSRNGFRTYPASEFPIPEREIRQVLGFEDLSGSVVAVMDL